MANKITDFLKDQVFILSIIITIISLVLVFMGVIWYGLRDMLTADEIPLGVYTKTITDLGEWNFFILAGGLVLLLIGVYYIWRYHKNKKFLLEELKTNKRSELIKNKHELEVTARHLPSKYDKMLKKKMKELKIK